MEPTVNASRLRCAPGMSTIQAPHGSKGIDLRRTASEQGDPGQHVRQPSGRRNPNSTESDGASP
jgi:hypothetical protein